jgi:MFS family permease
MADLVVSLLPLVLGIVMSPLAIMALVAVLLSRRARVTGVFFAAGWALGIALSLGASYAILGAFDLQPRSTPPDWVSAVRLVFAVVLLLGAVYIYRKGHARAVAMAHARTPTDVTVAAPQLPGWLRSVEHFTPTRSLLLGLGIFVLNPVDLSCAIIAALDVRLAGLGGGADAAILVTFGLLGVLPILVPVLLVLVRGARATPVLASIRTWIASHTSLLNAALVLVIALLQAQKAVSAFLA